MRKQESDRMQLTITTYAMEKSVKFNIQLKNKLLCKFPPDQKTNSSDLQIRAKYCTELRFLTFEMKNKYKKLH